MKQVFRYDMNGFYKEPVILRDHESIPSDCTSERPQDGLYRAKFVGGQWVEGLTQAEIEAFKNAPQPLSEIDILKKQQTDLTFELMMKGVL